MPSLRGSSSFKPIKGITIYGVTGPTGPQGPRGDDLYGPTGSTANLYLTGITLSGFTLITTFLDGTTVAAGTLKGITGDTFSYLRGKTGSTGFGYIFAGSSGDRQISIRKLKGTTAIRSSVNITSNPSTVTINVNRYDGGYTLVSGELTDIIATDSSNNFVGVTLQAAKYGASSDTVRINKTNVFEKTRGAAYNSGSVIYQRDTVEGSQSRTTVTIDPLQNYDNSIDRNTNQKIFVIDFNSTNPHAHLINIPDAPPYPYAFSVYFRGGMQNVSANYAVFRTVSGTPIKFPFGRQPCFRSGKEYLVHFISSAETWYAYIFNGNDSTNSYFCAFVDSSFTSDQYSALNFYSGLTGACCKDDGTCEILDQGSCSGYFVGPGTTCGLTGIGPCNTLGSCCIKNTVDGKETIYCLDNISSYDCLSLSTSGAETVFNGLSTTCEEVDCTSSFRQTGACCDGNGGCEQKTKEDCITSGKSFLGRGILCDAFGNQLCSSGTGACCYVTGTCSEVSAQTCFASSGFYHGSDTLCAGVTCTTDLGCADYLQVKLKPGDLFGGGVVVGVYSPKNSVLFGARHAFSRQGTTLEFLSGVTSESKYYQSEYDYNGYGITGADCSTLRNQDTDSYYIIASLYPASVDKNGKIINPTEELAYQDKFSWYGSGIAWGPLHNPTTYSLEELTYLDRTYEAEYLQYGEGYYGITGSSLNTIKDSTFQLCKTTRVNGFDPVARLFTRNIKTSNGIWNRNWGLYNTIRMISADNAYYIKSSSDYFTYSEFNSGDSWNSVYAVKLFDNNDYSNSFGLTGNPSQLSDWYIPSHDELAFLAANTITDSTNRYYGFDLNSKILENNGVPLYDWHWSSTGSFDETDSLEGIYVSGKPKHGTVAWAMYFDANGDSTEYRIKKEKRSKQLKVRPIRMLRCDGNVPAELSDSYKLWKTPLLLRNNL